MNSQGLGTFFRPRHVAVIGASATPGKLGHSVVRNLIKGGFTGRIYPVNPGATAVEGLPAFQSVQAIGESVDCVFLAVPAAHALAAVRDCAAAGVRAIVIGASGFAELGTAEGRELQAQIAGIALAAGMRVIGPNTNGLLDNKNHLSMGYNASHAESFRQGAVSFLSHSGALFDGIAKRLQAYGGGLSKFVAVGNELDVSMLDLLEFLVDDEDTRIIGLVIEGLNDGRRLRAVAARLAAAGKRVVVLKIGRSAEGASAALAHSSRLAGNSRAWDALLAACGFASVRTVEALAGACAVLSTQGGGTEDQRLVCVTTSGAGGAILADFAAEHRFAMAPQWDGVTAQTIDNLPTSAAIRHPIDMGSLGDWALLAPTLMALEQGGYLGPAIVYAHVAPGAGMARHLADALMTRKRRVAQPLVVLAPGGLGADVEREYTEAGIPVFHDTVTCFESLAAHFAQASPWQDLPAPVQAADAAAQVDALLDKAPPGQALSELQSAQILRLTGVPMVPSAVVRNSDECVHEAERLGYPVVLKAMVPGVAHKHAAGLVGIGISDAKALSSEWSRQQLRATALGATGSTQWLLQPMLKGRLELIAGVTHEPGLGHFLVFGLGGVHTELWDQIDLIPIPTGGRDLANCVAASHTARLLQAMAPSGTAQQALVEVLTSLQNLVCLQPTRIESIDVNPLLLVGDDLVAVDALVVPFHPARSL